MKPPGISLSDQFQILLEKYVFVFSKPSFSMCFEGVHRMIDHHIMPVFSQLICILIHDFKAATRIFI